MRRKFSLVVSQARQLQTELLVHQTENDHLTTRHRRELSAYQKSAGVIRKQLRTQGHRLQKYKDANKLLRRRNQELATDLEAARNDLDQVDHLRCNICMDSIKNVMTKCGHGFCRPCLSRWLRDAPITSTLTGPGERCPVCRQVVKEGDVQDIYLESDIRTDSVPEDDDATEVLSLDSDSESE
ncbi:hypothetical protein H2202_011137 [Exophiala xenobiotica]|nr:hypothetical protein H2202_011137 [Exophiala xenobiotica]